MLTLSSPADSDTAVAAYVEAGIRAVKDLDQAQPCGWVIDLRQSDGGNMWPMLTTIGPLLTGPTLGYFVNATGERTAWTLRDGRLLLGDRPVIAQANDYVLARPRPPVAILIGPLTASSAEATLIAFRGQPNTRSFGQANRWIRLGE